MPRASWLTIFLLVLSTAGCAVLTGQRAAQLAGVWDVTISNPSGDPLREQWTMQQRGTSVTGTVLTQRGTEVSVRGTLEGDKIALTVTARMPNGEARDLKVTATLDSVGNAASGLTRIGDNDREWTAKRKSS